MPTTPNLLLTHVEEGQQSREVTINEALDGLDVAMFRGAGPFDIGFFVPGVAPTTSLIWKWVFTRAGTFPNDFVGSEGHLETAPSSPITLDIQRNSVSVGSLVFTTAVGVFSTAGGATTIAIGDTLELHTPANMQSAADLGFTFLGARA